jgi:hypothetical protein
MRCFILSVVAAAAMCVTARAGSASLLGTTVNGQLNFEAGHTNFFDPANGLVPAGFLNHAGPTVTIGEPAIEFGFADPAVMSANFTGTQLIISDTIDTAQTLAPFTMTFTDTAFASVSEVGDTFPRGLSASLVGAVLTIKWGGGSATNGDTYTGTFNVGASVVPEPNSLLLAGIGMVSVAWYRQRRSKRVKD